MVQTMAATEQWFATWFDSDYYHKLYAHRDDTEAAGFVEALTQRLRPAAGSRALDVGCGAGRHARQLASRGFRVTGIDLAARSIVQAKTFERSGLRFVRHDMREPFGPEAREVLADAAERLRRQPEVRRQHPLRHARDHGRIRLQEVQVALLGRRAQRLDDALIFGRGMLLQAGAERGRIAPARAPPPARARARRSAADRCLRSPRRNTPKASPP